MAVRAFLICLLPFAFLARPGSAGEGVTPTEVRFAQVAHFEEPYGVLGREFRAGMLAAFEEVNADGGVHGRAVRLDSFDDGNEPEETATHVRKIVSGDGHLGILGMSGVQSARVVQPLVKISKTPFLAPMSGDPDLRGAAMIYVRMLRPAIDAEAEAWVRHLVDETGLQRVAVLYQNDLYGRLGLRAVEQALAQRDLTLHSVGRYPRNTLAVKMALLKIRDAQPQAVILLGENAPVIGFLEMADALEFAPVFVVGSMVAPEALAANFGEETEGLIATHFLPEEMRLRIPEAVPATEGEDPVGVVTMEGYLAGRYVVELLQMVGPELDRAAFRKAMMKMRSVSLDEVTLEFGLGDNQGMDQVNLIRLQPDGHFEPL